MRRRGGRRAYLRANRNRLRHTRNREKKEINKRQLMKKLGGYVILILIMVILGYSLVSFGGQTLRVIGQSMEPTLQNGDVVIVNKAGYLLKEPQRFDIIAFKQREGDNSYYNIKRIIGLPGEEVTIRDGHIFIDDILLQDIPFEENILTEGMALDGVTLGKGEYFVLGDNVNNSEDSRFANMGNILKNEILGKVVYRWLPKQNRGGV